MNIAFGNKHITTGYYNTAIGYQTLHIYNKNLIRKSKINILFNLLKD